MTTNSGERGKEVASVTKQIIVNGNIKTHIGNTTKSVESNIGLPNSYGRPKLSTERIKEEHDKIVNSFLEHFISLGYIKHDSVGINSGIDETVYFIGAPISVLKPFIVEKRIPDEGICMSQSCIRTRNSKFLFDDRNIPKWGSCFTGIAVLVNIESIERLLKDGISYLLNTLNIPLDNIRIQVNSKDKDLVELLNIINCPIELVFDEKEEKYYTHKYGMGDIVGRNFNFTLREEGTNTFNDIGNFIIIENGTCKYGVELALGTSVIMRELFALPHIMGTSCINNSLEFEKDILLTKLQDSIVSSILLFRSGIIPNASNTKGRVFRSYLRGILYFCNKFGISNIHLLGVIHKYEYEEYGEKSGAGEYIIEYIDNLRKELKEKKGRFSYEEKLIIENT